MGKHLQLHIAQPCHEDWDAMSAVERGRYCHACQKQVIDFTDMTDTQLATFFKKRSNETICGRFMSDQLDKAIVVPGKKIPWLKYAFTLSIPFLLSSFRSYSQGKPQISYVAAVADEKDVKLAPLMGFVSNGEAVKKLPTKISGKIVDPTGKPVPFASVMIANSTKGIAADSTGNFVLIVDEKFPLKLEVSAVGFLKVDILVNSNESLGDIKLKHIDQLGEVVVTGYAGHRKGSVTVGMTMVVGKTVKTKTNVEEEKFKVYPNPVRPGGFVDIDLRSAEHNIKQAELINLSGQVIKIIDPNILSGNKHFSFAMPLSISPGSYFIRVSTIGDKKSYTKKIVVR